MGDEDHRHAGFALQFLDQPQHLRLRRDVKRGRRFVRDQDFGLGDHRHGDHRALAHAAGHLERIGAEGAFGVGKAHAVEGCKRHRRGLGLADGLVQAQRLDHLIADPMQRRQRPHRLLEDHRDAVAAHVPHLPFADAQKVDRPRARCKDHAPRQDRRRLGQDAQHRAAGQRLARAAFAHQRQSLSAAELEADAAHHGVCPPEADGQVVNAQKCTHQIVPIQSLRSIAPRVRAKWPRVHLGNRGQGSSMGQGHTTHSCRNLAGPSDPNR